MDQQIDIIKTAREVIELEIQGLDELAQSIGASFSAAIELISKSKGRIIVTGMGKSGHIANKIAASLASTGTPAYAIHPAEAGHGDLGMIAKEDVVILLSNSGETSELSPIIDYCKRYNIKMLCMTRKKDSTLATISDIALVLPASQEASCIGAPTTSTTMMIALGDAIAVVLHKMHGFTKEDYSVYHPGGNIGARLKRVRDIMHTGDELPIIFANKTVVEAIWEMTSKHFGCVAVVEEATPKKLVGIITDGDLRRHSNSDYKTSTAADIMTADPKVISEQSYITEALNIMSSKSISCLFVVDDEQKLKGIIHIHDLLRAGL
jgi:arabinose-5-phosphate isomerase